MKQKKVFKILAAFLAVFLTLMPFFITFNSLLTGLVERNGLYNLIQRWLVPMEIEMVGVVVSAFGFEYIGLPDAVLINGHFAKITWNCLGWQSMLLLTISLLFGLHQSKYTLISKLQTILIGSLGVFLVNIARISFTVMLLGMSRTVFKIVFHDYLMILVTVGFLIVFWWFSYSYVLVSSESTANVNNPDVSE